MQIGAGTRKRPHQELILEDTALKKVASYKLLGVHVTETLKWDVHVTTMLSKASKRIHFIKLLRLQKRALRCIIGDVTYEEARSMFELSLLADRREELMRRFFDQLKRPDSCLAHLLPVKRELSLINYLRHARLHELPKTRTVRYAKSFIPYCIKHFM